MSFPFNPHGGLIIVPVTLGGPQREVIVELALDTGATTTVVNQSALEYAGLKLDEEGKPADGSERLLGRGRGGRLREWAICYHLGQDTGAKML